MAMINCWEKGVTLILLDGSVYNFRASHGKVVSMLSAMQAQK